MSDEPVIDSGDQFTGRGLMELFKRLEPLIRSRHMMIVPPAAEETGWRFNMENGDSDAGLPNGWGHVEFRDTTVDPVTDDPRGLLLWDKTKEGVEILSWKNFGDDPAQQSILVVKEGSITLYSQTVDGTTRVVMKNTGVTVQIATGMTFDVLDNGGNPIFRVDEDGDLHGKTGKALTFNL